MVFPTPFCRAVRVTFPFAANDPFRPHRKHHNSGQFYPELMLAPARWRVSR